METFLMSLVALSTLSWAGFALWPWGLWGNREVLDVVEAAKGDVGLHEITVLIPARNEVGVIQETLQSVIEQGPALKIILIDDGSEDGTVEKVRKVAKADLRVIGNLPLPSGWSGKLWALRTGSAVCNDTVYAAAGRRH